MVLSFDILFSLLKFGNVTTLQSQENYDIFSVLHKWIHVLLTVFWLMLTVYFPSEEVRIHDSPWTPLYSDRLSVNFAMYSSILTKVHEPEHSHRGAVTQITGWAITLIDLISSVTLMYYQLHIVSFFPIECLQLMSHIFQNNHWQVQSHLCLWNQTIFHGWQNTWQHFPKGFESMEIGTEVLHVINIHIYFS